jgi:hypothetical protein
MKSNLSRRFLRVRLKGTRSVSPKRFRLLLERGIRVWCLEEVKVSLIQAPHNRLLFADPAAHMINCMENVSLCALDWLPSASMPYAEIVR